jgi:putative sigma-54 modulation protein
MKYNYPHSLYFIFKSAHFQIFKLPDFQIKTNDMQVMIQSAPLTVDNTILSKATEKLLKLQKIYERIERCNVILKKEKSDTKKNFVVEVRLAVPRGDIFAAEGAESYGRALHYVVADLKKQLARHKQKLSAV